MAIDRVSEHPAGIAEQAGEFFHDLTGELKEEIHDLRTGEQPVEQKADLVVRRHVNGLVILLFAITAAILLAAIGAIYLFRIH